jgi:hypothetical protein
LASFENCNRTEVGVPELDLWTCFINANTIEVGCEAQMPPRAEVDMLARSTLVELAKKKLDQIKNVNTPISEVRKALPTSRKSRGGKPAWMEPWIMTHRKTDFSILKPKSA